MFKYNYLLVLLPPVFFLEPLPCEVESVFLPVTLLAVVAKDPPVDPKLPVDPNESVEPIDDALPVLPNEFPEAEPVPREPA